MGPRMQNNPDLAPESRLELGLFAAPFIPVSLFVFGWTARESVHWCVASFHDLPRTRH